MYFRNDLLLKFERRDELDNGPLYLELQRLEDRFDELLALEEDRFDKNIIAKIEEMGERRTVILNEIRLN